MEYGPGAGLDEKYCALIVAPSSSTLSGALSAISTALTGNGSGDYHGLASSKVSFTQQTSACSGSVPDGNSIRYRISSNWNSQCGTGYNCSIKSGSFFLHSTHYHYNSSDNFIRDDGLTNRTINHETGHSLGMADGNGTCPTGGSIMHSITYGCSTSYAYPTSLDRTRVIDNANGWD